MIWQEQSACIVMVTNLVEVGRVRENKFFFSWSQNMSISWVAKHSTLKIESHWIVLKIHRHFNWLLLSGPLMAEKLFDFLLSNERNFDFVLDSNCIIGLIYHNETTQSFSVYYVTHSFISYIAFFLKLYFYCNLKSYHWN